MAIELDDGTIVRSLPEQVDYLTTKNEENEIAIDNLSARLEAAIAGVLHYKGSVATYDDLPLDAEVGDVYNVIDTGSNYAWTGEEWDELGSSVDVSNLVSLDGTQTITGLKTFGTGFNLRDMYLSVRGTNDGIEINADQGEGLLISQDGIMPGSIGMDDLGSSSYKWKDLYLSGIAYLGSGSQLTQSADGNLQITLLGDDKCLKPSWTEHYNLGASGYKWKDLYLSGAINLPNNQIIKNDTDGSLSFFSGTSRYLKIAPSGVQFSTKVLPSSNNAFDIGRTAAQFKDLYLAGNLSNGTDTVTIADLAALIAYAKSQGWIS